MLKETALTWSWLNVLTKKRYESLVKMFGDIDHVLEHIDESLLKGMGCRDDTVEKTLNRLEEFDSNWYEKELKEREVQLISVEDDSYPAALKEIGDYPIFLYARGDISILSQPCIAVVGTRNISAYGKRVTESIVPDLVHAGMVTVSGLAIGVDALTAQETIAAGGRTVAVLGHGLAEVYPRLNAKLADQIVESGGLILSEFPLDAPPDTYTFPARNRIIAGLSLGTVIIEAGKGSGALITAELALEYNRDVFAVPGQIFDEQYIGCHEIIAKGCAKLITSSKDILQEFSIIAPESDRESAYIPQDETQQSVLDALTSMPQTVTDLVNKSGIDTGTMNAALTMMELSGGVKNMGGGMWVKT